MRKHKLAFIDIETTGLDFTKHEIIEIGCVVTTPRLKVLREFDIKVIPEHLENADPLSLKISHYDKFSWEKSIPLSEAIKMLSIETENCVMVGHNVSFDAEFLDFAFRKSGIENKMHYHRLDTISIAFAKLHKKTNLKHFSLRELCKYFDIKNEHAHTALSDARATFLLYKKLMSM